MNCRSLTMLGSAAGKAIDNKPSGSSVARSSLGSRAANCEWANRSGSHTSAMSRPPTNWALLRNQMETPASVAQA